MDRQGEGGGQRRSPHPTGMALQGRCRSDPAWLTGRHRISFGARVSSWSPGWREPGIAVHVLVYLASTHPSQPIGPPIRKESDETLGSDVARRNRRHRARRWPGGAAFCYDQRRVIVKALGGLRSGRVAEKTPGDAAVWQSGKGRATALRAASLCRNQRAWPRRPWATQPVWQAGKGLGDRARSAQPLSQSGARKGPGQRPFACRNRRQRRRAGPPGRSLKGILKRWHRPAAAAAGQGPATPVRARPGKSKLSRPSGASGTSTMTLAARRSAPRRPEQPARPPPILVEGGRCCRWDGSVELSPPLERDRWRRSVAVAADFSGPLRATGGAIA
jgi:hypothetical protein